MDFSYSSRKLEKALQDRRLIQKDYGERAKRLMLRLSVLKQARCLADVPRVPPMACHELVGSGKGEFAVTIEANWRLVFTPDHDPVPLKGDGGIDLASVTAIRIERIEDYH